MMAGKINSKRGSILVMAVVFSFVTVSLGMTFLSFAIALHNRVNNEIALKQAVYDCLAGAVRGFCDLSTGRTERGAMQELYRDNFSGYKILGRINDEGIRADYDKIVAYGRSNYMDSDINKEAIAEVVPGESFASFGYLIGKFRDPVRGDRGSFWTPDTIDGKVHVNDTINISSPPNDQPLFTGRVTTPYVILPRGNNARWLHGHGYRAPIMFPDRATEIRNWSGYDWGTSGHDSLTQIVLSDSLIYMRKCGKVVVNGVTKIHCTPSYINSDCAYSRPATGVIFVNGKVWVSASRGLVDMMDGEYPQDSVADGSFISQGFAGQLTIGSADTMIITDNLIYKHARYNKSIPGLDSCKDILGLVSENYIMVGKRVRDTVYIHASMAAVRGAITIQDAYCYQAPGWDNEKQSLIIWGSMAERNWGFTHTSYPDGHRRGFIEKDYHYDSRLSNNSSPHFPFIQGPRLNYVERERASL